MEQRGVPAETVAFYLVAGGSEKMIEAAVGKIRERWPKVEIEWRGPGTRDH